MFDKTTTITLEQAFSAEESALMPRDLVLQQMQQRLLEISPEISLWADRQTLQRP